ncbi:MAG TPA: SpoIVB peptidase [Patescibacteria group bacterium]|nr:SpoIVB peptidase [Patescibacteria group bacterium]
MHKKNAKFIIVNLVIMLMIIFAAYNFVTIYNYPNEINLMQGHSQKLENSLICRLVLDKMDEDNINLSKLSSKLTSFTLINGKAEGSANAKLKMFNLLPIKNVQVNVIPDKRIIPSGEAIGVKIQTKGVLVVGLSSITTADGKKHSPAADAGFEIGDTILEINGQKIVKDRDITNIVNNSKEASLNFLIEREGKKQKIDVKPVKSLEDSIYRIGLWVRDNIAGVGTMTFIDPDTNTFGALGHGITDIDSGVLVDISMGSVLKSKVASVQKARKTVPGEIVGIFYESDNPYGKINKNTNFGIYGNLNSDSLRGSAKPMQIGLSYQVKEGPAKILSTIDGSKVEEFDIEIQKVNRQNSPNAKSMLIKVTDKRLLEITGGIVQGMSGSPIIQDGRIVGAVTHVLVNDPTRGYGIFIEWMLEEADIPLEDTTEAAAGQ